MRILLIENDKRTTSFIARRLRQEGFAVDCAADGEEGLHLGSTESYDIAVVDIMLPKLDGIDTHGLTPVALAKVPLKIRQNIVQHGGAA